MPGSQTDTNNNGQNYANTSPLGTCTPVATLSISGQTSFTKGSNSGSGTITGIAGKIVYVTISANGATSNGYSISATIVGITSASVTYGSKTFSFILPASGLVSWNASFSGVDSSGGGSISVSY